MSYVTREKVEPFRTDLLETISTRLYCASMPKFSLVGSPVLGSTIREERLEVKRSISFSRKAGVPSPCSAYIGWKQPAVRPAKAATASSRRAMRVLANDIDDPHGNYDHLADGLAAQRQFYRIERQNGSLNLRILGAPWHGDITPFLAVDLDHQRHAVFNQQIAFDLRPSRLRNQPLLAQRLPAFLGQMRHHRRNELDQDDRGLPDRPSQIGRWLTSLVTFLGQHLGQRIGGLTDMGEADIEMQPLDASRHLVQRAMGRLAQAQRVGAEGGRPDRGRGPGDLEAVVHQPPQPLHEAR